MAVGYFHYYCSRDYDLALEQFGRALENQPNNSELLQAIGYVQRRQGRWEEALINLRRAKELDPMTYGSVNGLVMTLFYMHRLEEAEHVIDGFLEWAPVFGECYGTGLEETRSALAAGRDLLLLFALDKPAKDRDAEKPAGLQFKSCRPRPFPRKSSAVKRP